MSETVYASMNLPAIKSDRLSTFFDQLKVKDVLHSLQQVVEQGIQKEIL